MYSLIGDGLLFFFLIVAPVHVCVSLPMSHRRPELLLEEPRTSPGCVYEAGNAIAFSPGVAPLSLEQALMYEKNNSDGSCFPRSAETGDRAALINSATCCCSFWHPEANKLRSSSQALKLSDAARNYADTHACVASFPKYAFRPPPHTFMSTGEEWVDVEKSSEECGDVAVGISGRMASLHPQIWSTYLSAIETGIVEPLLAVNRSVNVFLHVNVDKNTNFKLPSPPTWLKSFVIEETDNENVNTSSEQCTRGMAARVFDEVKNRNPDAPFFDFKSPNSAVPMFRGTFLAYRMARAYAETNACRHKYYIRSRSDAEVQSFQKDGTAWLDVEKQLETVPILIGASPGIYKSRETGVQSEHRCVLDDQFAVGTVESMFQYASVFLDFADLVRYLPWYRDDFYAPLNERILTAHLHYRDANFVEYPINAPIIKALRADIKPWLS